MQIALMTEVPAYEQGAEPGRGGHSSRPGGAIGQVLLQDDAPDGLNFRLRRHRFQSGDKTFQSPRHCHTFQQIRFTEEGAVNIAPGQYVEQGQIGYFPRGAFYGPQTKDQGTSIAVQFGFNGEHQEGPVWDRYRDEALARLRARGRFEAGRYIELDPNNGNERSRDSVQALQEEQYELHTGRKFAYRPARYEAPILMRPDAFEYFELEPGVEVKRLGRFFDQPGPNGDVRLSIVRLSEGGTYALEADRAQLGWTIAAGLEVEGRSLPELGCLYCPRGEAGRVSGRDGVELYLVEFPRLD